tara:strand:+ start:11865 stop:13193 length:1329 start_codon:yes stop_codon:yes gene_type:complete
MKKGCLLIVFFLSLFWLTPSDANAQADVHLSVFKEAKKKIAIAVPDFLVTEIFELTDVSAVEGAGILKNDLNLSGMFDIIKPLKANDINRLDLNEEAIHYLEWENLGVHAVIKGEYAATENEITFKLSLYDIVNRRYLVGKLYRGQKSHLRQIMHKFADETVFQLTNETGIAQTKISFVSVESGHKELFVIDYDGYEKSLKRLSNDRSLILFPDWSSDGKKIVFTSYKNNNPILKIVSLEKGKNKVIVNFPGLNANPTWSPDGKKIAFTSSKDGNPEIYVIDAKGNIKRLTFFRGIDTSPTWSPDGKKIAFTSDRSGTPQIYIMDAEKGEKKMIKRITFAGFYNDQPAWSPKGDKIAYSSLIKNRSQIVIKDLKSGEEVQLTKKGSSKESPTWSPNGWFLAFATTVLGESAIYILQANRPGIRRLTFLKGGGFFPAWSPVLN